MRKYLFTVLLAVLCSTAINAQVNSEMGFILKVPYNNAHSTPLVRSVNETTIVAYYEHDLNGVFVVMQQGSLTADTIELPQFQYVYDFEIIGTTVYYCGKTPDASNIYDPRERAVVGYFDITPFLNNNNNGMTTTINYCSFEVEGRDHNKLKKMIAYTTQGVTYVMAIGESFLCDQPNQPCHSGLDFFTIIKITSNGFQEVKVETFTSEFYHDIIETANHAVLVGGDFSASTSNAICFRKLRKYNIPSTERDYLYRFNLSNTEPLTFVYGTQIEGSDRFITSTFGNINGNDGTIIRTFNTSNMEMMAAQFIPSPGEKTQPYELHYVPETGKVLLLQLSTDHPTTRIYTIDPYPTQNYSTIWEYHPNWHLHSFDMYRDDEYIAIGTTSLTPGFYARNVLYNTPNCMRKNNIDVEMIDIFQVEEFHIPLNFTLPSYSSSSLTTSSSSQRNLILDCH